MSETLLNWLNNEVKLSVPISDISSQFANGFLFGELLSRYKLLPTFDEFKNTTNRLDITKNYGLLQKAFSDLSIQLTEVQKGELLAKKKYKAEMYLYKLRQKISNKLIDLDSIMERTSMNQLHEFYKELNFGNYDQRLKREKLNLDASKGDKRKGLQSARLNPVRTKFACAVGKLKNFNQTKRENDIIQDIISEEDHLLSQYDERKQNIFNKEKSKHIAEVNKDKSNLNGWRTEIDKKNKFDQEQKDNYYKESVYYKTATMNGFSQSNEDNQIVIKAFDQNLSKLGLDLKVIDPKMAKQSNKTMNSDIFIARIRQQIAEKERSKKEKEKRMRKLQSANLLNHQRITTTQGRPITTNTNNIFSATNQTFYKNSTRATTAKVQTARRNNNLPPIVPISENNYNDWGDYVSVDVYDEKRFFNELNKETSKYRMDLMNRKKEKRERDSKIVSPLIDQLVELVEECFTYQVINKKELIELDQWKILMDKFIHGQKLSLVERKEKKEIVEHKEIENIDFVFDNNLTQKQIENSFSQFESDELLNYMYYLGDFDLSSYVSNNIKLDVTDIMGSEIKFLQNDIDVKPYNTTNSSFDDSSNPTQPFPSSIKFGDIYEPRTEDLEMIKLPKENSVNLYYGELIGDIVDRRLKDKEENENVLEDINNNTEQQQQSEQNEIKEEEHSLYEIFESLPIKIAFIGNEFAGKATQAKMINDSYNGIKVYSIKNIIKNLLDIQEKYNTPIESHPKFKSLKKAQLEQMKNEKKTQEEILLSYKELLDKVNALENKEEIPDEVQIDFLLKAIKSDFKFKDKNTISQEIQAKRDKVKRMNEELDKIHEEQVKKPKAKIKEEQYIKEELKKMSMSSYYGFIITDFPKNVEQARIFEFKINGYTQAIENNKTESEIEKENLLYFCDKDIKASSLSIKDCALNKFLIFDITEEEIIRRASNRKLDPQTNTVYHMTDNPPNDNDKKLKERLVELPSPTSEEVQTKIANYLKNYDEIMEFYLNFHSDKVNIESNQTKQIVFDNINTIITEMVNKFEIEILPLPIEEEAQQIQAENQDQVLNSKPSTNSIILQTKTLKKGMSIKVESSKNVSNLGSALMSPVHMQIMKNKINQLTVMKMPIEIIDKVYSDWKKFTMNYMYYYKEIFNTFRCGGNSLTTQLTKYQEDFIKFISSPSDKKEVIQKFIVKYKAFLNQYNSLKLHDLVKNDFNRDLGEVTDQLWDMIEKRKDEAINELKSITNSDFVEKEMKKFHISLEKMFILETEKIVHMVNNIISFYSSNADGSIVKFELLKGVSFEILKNTDSLPYIKEDFYTKEITYPKLERIFKNCFIVLFKLMIYIKQNDKIIQATKISNDVSSMPRRRKNKGSPEKSDVLSTQNENDEMIKTSIKVEMNKYKYRVNMLSCYGIKKLKTIFSISKTVFDTMDEWIITSVKKQNDAMNEMISHLRNVVEYAKIHEISKTVEMDDFHSVYKLINVNELLENAKIKIKRKNSDITDDSFSVNFFGNIITQIKEFEIQHNIISKEFFTEIFFNKNLLNKENKIFFSVNLQRLTYHNISSFLEYFVFLSSDICLKESVNEKEKPQELILSNAILTVLLLSFVKVPTEAEASAIKENNKDVIYRNCLMKKKDFLNLNLWYENSKQFKEEMELLIEDEKSIKNYDKGRRIKELLFELNKMNENEINIDIFIDIITLRAISKSKQPKQISSIIKYYDLFNI